MNIYVFEILLRSIHEEGGTVLIVMVNSSYVWVYDSIYIFKVEALSSLLIFISADCDFHLRSK